MTSRAKETAMHSRQEVEDLLEQARRNEKILKRLDQVEEFLLAHHGLKELLRHLGRRVANLYELEAVSLVLVSDNQRLAEALENLGDELPDDCFTSTRQDLRLLLLDLERPYLSNRLSKEMLACFFPKGPFVASSAIVPLWVRGELLGTLNLGSSSPRRYTQGFETDFLRRLGRKLATGLDAALLMEQTRYLERREAAVEMAGAACHNLAQPLTTATLIVEKLDRMLPSQGPERESLDALRGEVERLGELVQRISQVNEYTTRPYAQGLRIVDVDASGPKPDPQSPSQGRELPDGR
jgi:uncharacterized protein YigA (DUF484 family)